MTTLQQKLDAIVWAECEEYRDGIRYDRDTVRLEAALALLAVCREWLEAWGHAAECTRREIGECICGYPELLAKLDEVLGHE